MAQFNLTEYETVQDRLNLFWKQFPNGRVSTSIVEIQRLEGGQPAQYVVMAELYRDTNDVKPFATGFAEELVGTSLVNKTSALENGETSAIGRALKNGGIGAGASREEMEKVERHSEPVPQSPKPDNKIYGELPRDGVTIRDPQAEATEKQINALVKKGAALAIYSDVLPVFLCWWLGIEKVRKLTKQEASSLIGADESEWEVKVGLFKVAPRTEYPELNDDYAPF